MKKFFIKSLSLILALCLCISAAGCYLFELPENNEGGNPPSTEGGGYTPNGGSGTPPVIGEGTVPDISGGYDYIKFDKLEERKLLTRTQAVSKVERSVVEIKMTTDAGTSSGSGVIVGNCNDEDNIFYIITCHHVISSGGTINVYVPDMNTRNYGDSDYDTRFAFTGTIDAQVRKNEVVSLIGGDQASDIAVLKFDVTNANVTKDQIVYANLPTEETTVYKAQRGEDVFAIGNPGGELPMTVSAGIISYLDRETVISSVGYMTLMQIDVPINHGNSGGGLFNYYGELIGITNAGSDVLEGIKYAIPYRYEYTSGGFVSSAKELVGTYYAWEEKNHGFIEGRWSFGITIASNSTTATIQSVVVSSNAANAGLKQGDKILNFSYEKASKSYEYPISSRAHLEDAMNKMKRDLVVGDSFDVVVYRSGEQKSFTVELTEQFIFCDTGVRILNTAQQAA